MFPFYLAGMFSKRSKCVYQSNFCNVWLLAIPLAFSHFTLAYGEEKSVLVTVREEGACFAEYLSGVRAAGLAIIEARMVKLFVGNLTPGTDPKKLKALFSQYGRVVELDVIKNFAFVHMATDEEADRAVRALDNHNFDGRPIHIEKSTSRLRKAPGMAAVCYSCGALDHKTPQCPRDPAKQVPFLLLILLLLPSLLSHSLTHSH